MIHSTQLDIAPHRYELMLESAIDGYNCTLNAVKKLKRSRKHEQIQEVLLKRIRDVVRCKLVHERQMRDSTLPSFQRVMHRNLAHVYAKERVVLLSALVANKKHYPIRQLKTRVAS